MNIGAIVIGERHRKDMGDVASLAKSIHEIGLLHPVVVTPDGTLIAGARRIAACRMLGWQDIPVRILYEGDKLRDGGNMYTVEDIGQTCAICGYPFAHMHHILPRAYGGEDTDENLVALCPNHHAAVHFLLSLYVSMSTDDGQHKIDKKPKTEAAEMLAKQDFLCHCDPALHTFYRETITPLLNRQVRNAAQ